MLHLLVIGVTYYTHQNRISDSITHVPLNTINGVVFQACSKITNIGVLITLLNMLMLR